MQAHLSRESRDIDSCAFPLKDISKGLKVAIPSSDDRRCELESWNIGLGTEISVSLIRIVNGGVITHLGHDFIVCKHPPSAAMCLRVSHFNFQKGFGRGVHFVKLNDRNESDQ